MDKELLSGYGTLFILKIQRANVDNGFLFCVCMVGNKC
jgi:hypothetical protein